MPGGPGRLAPTPAIWSDGWSGERSDSLAPPGEGWGEGPGRAHQWLSKPVPEVAGLTPATPHPGPLHEGEREAEARRGPIRPGAGGRYHGLRRSGGGISGLSTGPKTGDPRHIGPSLPSPSIRRYGGNVSDRRGSGSPRGLGARNEANTARGRRALGGDRGRDRLGDLDRLGDRDDLALGPAELAEHQVDLPLGRPLVAQGQGRLPRRVEPHPIGGAGPVGLDRLEVQGFSVGFRASRPRPRSGR